MRFILCAIILPFLWIRPASAWVNGELSIWMDADRVPAMQKAGHKFEHDYGIKVNVDATENIPNNFSRVDIDFDSVIVLKLMTGFLHRRHSICVHPNRELSIHPS